MVYSRQLQATHCHEPPGWAGRGHERRGHRTGRPVGVAVFRPLTSWRAAAVRRTTRPERAMGQEWGGGGKSKRQEGAVQRSRSCPRSSRPPPWSPNKAASGSGHGGCWGLPVTFVSVVPRPPRRANEAAALRRLAPSRHWQVRRPNRRIPSGPRLRGAFFQVRQGNGLLAPADAKRGRVRSTRRHRAHPQDLGGGNGQSSVARQRS